MFQVSGRFFGPDCRAFFRGGDTSPVEFVARDRLGVQDVDRRLLPEHVFGLRQGLDQLRLSTACWADEEHRPPHHQDLAQLFWVWNPVRFRATLRGSLGLGIKIDVLQFVHILGFEVSSRCSCWGMAPDLAGLDDEHLFCLQVRGLGCLLAWGVRGGVRVQGAGLW